MFGISQIYPRYHVIRKDTEMFQYKIILKMHIKTWNTINQKLNDMHIHTNTHIYIQGFCSQTSQRKLKCEHVGLVCFM